MQSHTRLLIVVCIIGLIVAIVGCYKTTSDISNNQPIVETPEMPTEITPATTTTIVSTSSVSNPIDTATQVEITSPLPNSEVKSPITVTGKAKGGWFFEANAGLAVLDANKQPITIGNVTATSDWMTADYVSFTGKITYPAAYKGQNGYIQFSNDNPSGLPENSKTFLVPVLFR